MQVSEIIITNIIESGTAFGAVAEGINESVFIPSKNIQSMNLQVGERVSALLVANTSRPDKTPWLAIKVDRIEVKPEAKFKAADKLAELILRDLDEGYATASDIAESIGRPVSAVTQKLADLVRSGLVVEQAAFGLAEMEGK
ncbi:HTH_ARSR domain containing protein [uncultured Caudovirales phage]|uniref:HTH_ARSR domain containing protein n=1 Tax=uncultured Caudovirales phage TaxID=2100421 RepID=A0A6J5MX75_9CAUD|nr:HTH_ARSR domain containing protein [uncultured Caudovirales phage]